MLIENLGTFEVNEKVAAVFQVGSSSTIFDYEDVRPQEIKKGYRGFVAHGEDNDLPTLMLEKIRKSEVMSSNMFSNILSCYGNGFRYEVTPGHTSEDEVKTFFRRNNMVKFMLEQMTDIKHFYFSVCLLMMSTDGKKILRIKHKEATNARFEVNNPKTGKIENVFFANWAESPKDKNVQVYPVLDQNDPYWDLMVRMGLEPDPETAKRRSGAKKRIFAIVTRIPTPGHKYYPFPYYAAHFNSGWYDISTMIPLAKKAKMTNGMMIKYHVEFHEEYFELLYKEEKITDPKKQLARRKKEFNDIKTFLSGIENSGKVWYSGYYLDPNGKENRMIRINVIDKEKAGGDYIEDAEEASNVQCYAQGVHPSLIGATPGKSKGGFSGSDKRELFTIKQAQEKVFRDLLMIPLTVTQEYNQWDPDLTFEIPHLMLTTLDEGTDAKEVIIDNSTEKDDSN